MTQGNTSKNALAEIASAARSIPAAIPCMMALAWSMDSFASLAPVDIPLHLDIVSLGLCCALGAAFPLQVRSLFGNRRSFALLCIVALASSAALAWGASNGIEVFFLILVSIAIASFQAVVLLGNFSALAQMPMKRLLATLLAWLFATGLCIIIAGVFPSPFERSVFDIVAVVLIVLLRFVPQDAGSRESPAAESCDDDPQGSGRIPVGLLVVQFVILFVIKACAVLNPGIFTVASGLGFVCASVCIAAWFLLRARILNMKKLYNIALLLTEVTLVITAVPPVSGFATCVLNGAAYVVFASFCFTIYGGICRRQSIVPERLFGLAIACECVASILGALVCWEALWAGIAEELVLLALSALVAVTFLFLFDEKDFRSDWSDRKNRPVTESVVAYYYTLPDICTAIARQYGLSKREEGVLQLLAQKKNGPDIASELFISQDTVKTHVKGIYRKLGVHSRSELYEFLDTQDDTAHED